MGSRTVYFRECQCKRRSKLQKVKIALPQRFARRLEAQALEAGFDPEEYVIQVLARKVGGVNGKEVTDPRTFTSLFSPSLSQTALMPQETPSVSLDADRYIARPETIKEAVVVGAWTKL